MPKRFSFQARSIPKISTEGALKREIVFVFVFVLLMASFCVSNLLTTGRISYPQHFLSFCLNAIVTSAHSVCFRFREGF
jgi:hypothetical protein